MLHSSQLGMSFLVRSNSIFPGIRLCILYPYHFIPNTFTSYISPHSVQSVCRQFASFINKRICDIQVWNSCFVCSLFKANNVAMPIYRNIAQREFPTYTPSIQIHSFSPHLLRRPIFLPICHFVVLPKPPKNTNPNHGHAIRQIPS